MTSQPLTIWCNADFSESLDEELVRKIAPHRLIWARNRQSSNLVTTPPESETRTADIAFGQPHPDDVINSKTLRWIHLTTAGYTRYDTDGVRAALKSRDAVMTNSSSVYSEPCAEHLVACMLCATRSLPPVIVNDATEHKWLYLQVRPETRLLLGQSAVLAGFGAIARRIVELLAPYRMNLSAVRRKVQGDETIRTLTTDHLDELLPQADHVINVLPAAAGTANMFNAARFAKMKRGAIFYNIGRGDTVDQEALGDALEAGHLNSAYLDVTTPEPLPPEHRLWHVPNCYITTHIAGGRSDEKEAHIRHFSQNIARFTQQIPMLDRII